MSSDLCPDYHKETNLTGTTPCNRVNGSVNTHSGEVYYDSFGYLLTTSSTDA